MTEHKSPLWRFINSPPCSGAENMAVDEALLRSFEPGVSLPMLRLYSWNPPALSLGRFQKAADVLDIELCRSNNVDIVRRITGGGVIYHADELTYSLVCTPEQMPAAATIKESFRILTGFLISFYRSLGIESAFACDRAESGEKLGERTAFCFAGKESYDIVTGGAKIGGNAQRRLKGVIFQHGSIPLLNRASTGLAYMKDKSFDDQYSCTSLAESGIKSDKKQLFKLLGEAFAGHFNCRLAEDTLSVAERADVQQLLAKRYHVDRWNLEGCEV